MKVGLEYSKCAQLCYLDAYDNLNINNIKYGAILKKVASFSNFMVK